jgi:prophage antirepressor-like protein
MQPHFSLPSLSSFLAFPALAPSEALELSVQPNEHRIMSKDSMTSIDRTSTLYFRNAGIRVVSIDSKPWFIAADVFRALGIVNCSTAVKSLRTDEVRLTEVLAQRPVHALSEKGLLKKLKRSVKPEAQALLHWALHEAIPAYKNAAKAAPAEQRGSPDAVSRLAARVAELEQQLATLSAAALFTMQSPSQRQSRML